MNDDRNRTPPEDGRLHIGATAWETGLPGTAEQFARQAEFAESMGFDSFWLPEFHFDEAVALPQPLLPLAAVAARTRQIRLGTGSHLLPIRHPVQLAEEVAVLDRLSGGRVILGVGRGFRPALFDAYEVPANEKRPRFERALEAMLAAWKGEPLAWEEDADASSAPTPARLVPRPVQQPHPPVWVAAFGPRALTQAGQLGFPYIASPLESMEALARNLAHFREAAAAAGRPPPAATPIMRTIFVSRDRARLEEARRRLAEQAATLSRSPLAAIRNSIGREPEDWAFVGEPEAVRDRIETCRERFSMTHLIASRTRLPGLKPDDFLRSLEHLAELAPSLDR